MLRAAISNEDKYTYFIYTDCDKKNPHFRYIINSSNPVKVEL